MFVCRRSYPDHEKTVFGKMDLFPGLFLPGLSTVKNVVDIFAKYVWKPNPVSLSGWRATYYKHITEKSVGRCIFLVIPVLGPIAVLLAEFLEESYIDSLKEKVKEGDIDAIKKLCKEPDTAKERKEALEGLFSKATFSEEERKLVIEMGAACSTVKDTSPLQKTALSGVKETICEWFAKEMLEPWWQMEDLVSLYEYLDKLNRDVNLSWDSSCDEDVHPMAVALRPHILTCVKDKLDSFGLDEVVKWYRASILPEKLKTCAFTVAVRKWIDSSGPENANEADAVCRLYTSDVTDREAIFVFATKEAEGGSLKALDRLWLLMRLTRQLKFPLQEAKLFRWFREVAKKPSAPLQRAAMDRILFFVCTRDVTVDVEYTFSAMLVVDFAIFSTKDKEYLVSKLIGLAKDNRGRKFLSWLEALAEQDQRCVLIAKALAKVYQEYGEKAQTFFWNERAANLGDVESMCLAGDYLNRKGDLTGALGWYKKAAAKGHPAAKRVVAASEAKEAERAAYIKRSQEIKAATEAEELRLKMASVAAKAAIKKEQEVELRKIAGKYKIPITPDLDALRKACLLALHPDKNIDKPAAEIEVRRKDFQLVRSFEV